MAGTFLNQYGFLLYFAAALLILPPLLTIMVTAPLVAREYEQRTNLLAWMQSISRLRWLSMQLIVILGAGLLASAGVMALVTWWYTPFDQIFGKFNPVAYDFTGPVFIAATVLSLALGIFAGALTRRTVLAIFLTLALILAIRLPVEFDLRANFEPQVTVTWPLQQGDTPPVNLNREDWHIGDGFIDPQGNKTNNVNCSGDGINQTLAQCMQSAGYRGFYLTYQPANRFWTFQWIESSIYLALTLLALAATFWLVRRRTA